MISGLFENCSNHLKIRLKEVLKIPAKGISVGSKMGFLFLISKILEVQGESKKRVHSKILHIIKQFFW